MLKYKASLYSESGVINVNFKTDQLVLLISQRDNGSCFAGDFKDESGR